jgi:hypothetical protein
MEQANTGNVFDVRQEQANTRNAFRSMEGAGEHHECILRSRRTPGALLAANIAEDHCPAIIHVGISGLERGMSALPPKADIG